MLKRVLCRIRAKSSMMCTRSDGVLPFEDCPSSFFNQDAAIESLLGALREAQDKLPDEAISSP